MEKCVKCAREYDKQNGMLYCPYCGYKFDQIVLGKDLDLTEKIENIWGNQGVYAEKVKSLSLTFIDKLKNDIKDVYEKNYNINSINSTIYDFEEQFDSLISAQSKTHFTEIYFGLMDKNNAILSGEIFNYSDSYIRKIGLVKEAMISFENSLELSIKSNTVFNMEMTKSTNMLDDISKGLLFELSRLLEVSFSKVEKIISEFGLFCVTNSGFNKYEARVLRDNNFIENNLVTTSDLEYIINLLKEENVKNDSVILNMDSDMFILLFLESMWLFIRTVSSYSYTPSKDELMNQISSEMKRWVQCVEVCIDRSKYSNTIDMIDVYQRTKSFVDLYLSKSY